jgi:hypothetical protein
MHRFMDPKETLAAFKLTDLAQFTRSGVIPPEADHKLFFAGRDDIHGILMFLWSRCQLSAYCNMFGYDDEDLNTQLMRVAEDPTAYAMFSLDRSQAGGKHEAAILASNAAADHLAYRTHFTIMESSTGQISHTKGGVLDGAVGYEGSTNWSTSGEGTWVVPTGPGGAGYKSQNNTLMVFVDHDTITHFTSELVAENASGRKIAPKADTITKTLTGGEKT